MRATLRTAIALIVITGLSLAGTVAVAVVGAWAPPITLSESGQDAGGHQLVTDGTTITAIWQRSDGTNNRIQVSSSTDGGTNWSTPVTISEAGQNAVGPQLVTDGTTITTTWYRFDGTNNRIQASSSTDGGTNWSAPVTISVAGQNAVGPQLVTDGATITTTWHRFDGTHDRIQASSSTDGGATWSTPATLSVAGQSAYLPQLVTNGATITASWRRYDGTHHRIQASSSTNGGATWSTPVTLSVAGQNAWAPKLVADGDTITATWRRYDASNWRVQVASSTDAGATWGTPVTVSGAGQDAWGPQLVTNGATITTAWYRSDGTHDRVQVSSSTDGGVTWSTPVTLSEAGQNASYEQLVTNGTTITATWYRSDGTHHRVQVSSSTDGGVTWSPPVTLSDAGQSALYPQLATYGTTITVVWMRYDGSTWRVQVASSTGEFSDVPPTHPFYDEIIWLADSGITGGYSDGTFRPSTAVTRQAMSAFLYRADGSPVHEPPAVSPFSDVGTTHPFYKHITWMAESDISTGYTDGSFRSSDPVTRQAMSAFLYRAAGSPAHTPPTVSPFSDVATTHPFYLEITWMAESGISTGYTDGTFKPSNAVTRQAMAAFLQRMDALVV